ncbi:extracellular calcium-sensing receptor-like [Notothenia coriiceps]|uniref:Extracellular calcium-sensing receptor-like n=1 Tax=Notothenia coriiceps TaxID=8208 RepID=A0A6I9P951_9TELE|nr:PREDICTED: extracellular calcium-sensing receptor-like [Notothenia coriiceps]
MVIGGLFNLYYTPSAVEQGFTKLPHYKPCTGLDLMSLKNAYAMVFALEEINRNSTLLPGVKLGYRLLDSCFNSLWALQSALSLIGGDAHSCNSTASNSSAAYDQPGEKAGGQSVPLLIGAASSTTTLILSRILGPLSISYLASCPCLSDRYKFPNVFRTIPSDLYQARAMAQLAIRFRWTWIGAVVINNDYGNLAIQTFQKETQGKGVCLEFIETVGRETILIDARRAALKIQASTAKVILIFCWYTDVKKVFLELAKIHVTDRQFLASEAWSTSDEILKDLAISKVASGVLGVAIRSSKIPGFENYLRSLNPTRHPDDDFLREFWEMEFGCSPGATQSQASLMKASLPPCSGRESLEEVQNHFTDTSQLRVAYNVYLAVYAAAHALHSLLSCPNRDSSSGRNSSCSSSKQIKPFELLQSLNKVNVTTPQGEIFYFEGADIPAKYDLVNWQNTPEGSLKLVLIGRVDGFDINLMSHIEWNSVRRITGLCQCALGPGAGFLGMKWFGPANQEEEVCLFLHTARAASVPPAPPSVAAPLYEDALSLAASANLSNEEVEDEVPLEEASLSSAQGSLQGVKDDSMAAIIRTASLILASDEALRPEVRCPRPQCRVTHKQLCEAYDAAARMGRIRNSLSHLMLAVSTSLQQALAEPSCQASVMHHCEPLP